MSIHIRFVSQKEYCRTEVQVKNSPADANDAEIKENSIQALFHTNTLNSAIFQESALSKLGLICNWAHCQNFFYYIFLPHWPLTEEVS